MKIIHIINSLGQGGAEMTLIRLINHSKESHLIITILKNDELKNKIKKNIKIISILPISLKKIKYIHKQIKLYSPDIFQGWMYHGDLISSIFGLIYRKKIFWNLRHGKMSIRYSSKRTIILRTILSIFSHFIPSKIISCSKEGLIVHKRIGYCRKKIIIIPNGINQEYKKNIDNLDFLNQKELIIASIGRDNRQKDRTYFLKIIKELSIDFNIKALIVGRGVTSSLEIKNEISKYRFDIKLLESFDSISDIFKKIDILLLTSNFGEGCPNILIEALQAKILCFSTDVGDSKYILNNSELIMPDNNPKESKIIISNLIKNPRKYVNIIELNYHRSKEEFSPIYMANKYETIWNSI